MYTLYTGGQNRKCRCTSVLFCSKLQKCSSSFMHPNNKPKNLPATMCVIIAVAFVFDPVLTHRDIGPIILHYMSVDNKCDRCLIHHFIKVINYIYLIWTFCNSAILIHHVKRSIQSGNKGKWTLPLFPDFSIQIIAKKTRWIVWNYIHCDLRNNIRQINIYFFKSDPIHYYIS